MVRLALMSVLVLLHVPIVWADDDEAMDVPLEPPPSLLKPPAPSAALKQKYDALRLFARARLMEKDRRPVEAAELYEKALLLDPCGAPILKALVPLCFHLDRTAKALEYCRRALDQDPEDYDLAFKYAQTLRDLGRRVEALPPLSAAVKAPGAKERPALHAEMLYSLGTLQEELNLHGPAAESFAEVAALLDRPELILADPSAVSRPQLLDETARTYERLGRARLKAGQHDQAIEAFKKAHERSPQKSTRLNLNLSEAHQAAGRLKEALACLELHLATQPSEIDGYEKQIELLTSLGRAAEIVPSLERAAQRDAFNHRLKLLLAQQYVAAQDPERAEAVYTAVFSITPTEEAYRGLAGLYAQLGRWEELLRRFDECCGDPQRAQIAKLQLDVIAKERVLVEGLGQMASLFAERKAPTAARTRRVLAALCRQARLYGPAETLLRSLLAEESDPGAVYLELCRVLSEAGLHAKEAELCAEALTKKTAVEPRVFKLERVRALSLSGQHQLALAQADALVKEAAPGSEELRQARFMRATVNFRAGENEAAAAEGEQCLAAAPLQDEQLQIRHLLAAVYSHLKRPEAAQKHLEALFEAAEDDPIVLNDLAYHWAEQGKNLEEAERLSRRAIELDRAERLRKRSPLDPPGQPIDSASMLDTLAWVLHQRGRHAEAARLLETAAKLPDGEDPTLHEHRGDVYDKLGDPLKANDAWKQAVSLYSQPKWRGQVDRRQMVEQKLQRLEIIRVGGPVKP